MPSHKVAIPRAVVIRLPNAEGELEMRKVPLQDWSHSVAHSDGQDFWEFEKHHWKNGAYNEASRIQDFHVDGLGCMIASQNRG